MRSGRLAVLDEHGRRQKVHPAAVDGRWHRRVLATRALLIAIFVVAPFVRAHGHPLLLLEIGARRFWVFGHSFNSQDAPFAFLVLSAVGFSLIAMASTVGRVWCGWACPQTVWLEGVVRPIEAFFEGSAVERRRLEKAAWGPAKAMRFVAKHVAFLAVALFVAHWAVCFFVRGEELLQVWRGDASAPPGVLAILIVLTSRFYWDFAWFREQTCLVLCPYGRLQGSLQDRDTLLIGYDARRGEPRAKASVVGAGDCVDCKRCVAVCPTGIDIRDGLQMECVGCSACIDACDDVMTKLARPKGLLRYASEASLSGGKTRVVRPRTVGYGVAALVGLAVVFAFVRSYEPFEANVLRAGGVPYAVDGATLRAPFGVHVVNKQSEAGTFTLAVEGGGPDATVQIPTADFSLEPFAGRTVPVLVSMPVASWKPGFRLTIRVHDALSGRDRHLSLEVLGPRVGVR